MEMMEELKEKTKQEVKETPGADFFMGIVLMALSAVVCLVAWSWPRTGAIASSAALFPVLIASTLFIMALSLFVGALRRGGHRAFVAFFSLSNVRRSWREGNLKLVLASLATVLLYLVVVLNLFSFEVGTFLFLVGALLFFWRANPLKIIAVSACIVAFYYLSFKVLFKLVLPGAGM